MSKHSGVRYSKEDIKRIKVERKFDKRSIKKTGVCGRQLKNNEALRNVNSRKKIVEDHLAMPLSQMFDKVFGMIKSNMYAIKLQEKVRELSVLDTTNRQIRVICLRGLLGVR